MDTYTYAGITEADVESMSDETRRNVGSGRKRAL